MGIGSIFYLHYGLSFKMAVLEVIGFKLEIPFFCWTAIKTMIPVLGNGRSWVRFPASSRSLAMEGPGFDSRRRQNNGAHSANCIVPWLQCNCIIQLCEA